MDNTFSRDKKCKGKHGKHKKHAMCPMMHHCMHSKYNMDIMAPIKLEEQEDKAFMKGMQQPMMEMPCPAMHMGMQQPMMEMPYPAAGMEMQQPMAEMEEMEEPMKGMEEPIMEMQQPVERIDQPSEIMKDAGSVKIKKVDISEIED